MTQQTNPAIEHLDPNHLGPDQLNAYNTFVGDPGYFERDRARYQAVTPASLQRAVDTYIHRASRVTLSIIPRGRHALAIPDSAPAVVS